MAEHKGTWWIWKVFWILLIVTAAEVVLGIIKPVFFLKPFLGTSLLNVTFLVMTLFKASYIVMVFMHLGFEKKSLQYTILIPVFILIPYLAFILLNEGGFQHLLK